MEYLGIVALCLVIALGSRVDKLERILRENGIVLGNGHSSGGKQISDVLASRKGSVVTLQFTEQLDIQGEIVDMDEEWVLMRIDGGKNKPPKEKLVRLNDVTSVKNNQDWMQLNGTQRKDQESKR